MRQIVVEELRLLAHVQLAIAQARGDARAVREAEEKSLAALTALREQAGETSADDLPTVLLDMSVRHRALERGARGELPDAASPYMAHLRVREGESERGRRTVITMLGNNVFESGSADVNPAYENTLQQVADAMNKVPGSVTIVGHTDNQAIKSLRFRDNDELSRERAESVAAVLRKTMTPPPNLRIRGAGSSQPAALPESDPQNRARNRRVEIIHVR